MHINVAFSTIINHSHPLQCPSDPDRGAPSGPPSHAREADVLRPRRIVHPTAGSAGENGSPREGREEGLEGSFSVWNSADDSVHSPFVRIYKLDYFARISV